MDNFDPCDYEDCRFPRLSKRESSKHTNQKNNKRQKEITNRNMLQKEKQSRDKLSRNYRKIERNEKQDGSPRTYQCNTCKQECIAPCKCNYIDWCGKECEWYNCYLTTIPGVQDISWDTLCRYHMLKHWDYLDNYEYLEKSEN